MLYQGFSSKSFCLENHVLEGVWQWGYEFFVMRTIKINRSKNFGVI